MERGVYFQDLEGLEGLEGLESLDWRGGLDGLEGVGLELNGGTKGLVFV